MLVYRGWVANCLAKESVQMTLNDQLLGLLQVWHPMFSTQMDFGTKGMILLAIK